MRGSSIPEKDLSEVEHRLYPGLLAFAIALTGSPRAAADLPGSALVRLRAAGPAQTPIAVRAYQELHSLWLHDSSEQNSYQVDPRCFTLPAKSREAASKNKGLARIIADLPAQQRATLLLVYGEGFSYDEVAEIFGTDVKSVMTRLVRGHVAVGHWIDRRENETDPARPNDQREGSPDGVRHQMQGRVA